MTYTDTNGALGKGYSHILLRKIETSRGLVTYYEGIVITPHGIVDAYSQDQYTSLLFAWRGRQYRRTYKKEFTPRTLSRLAKQFARDIVNQNDYS